MTKDKALRLALEALEWFLENDDTNIGQDGNEFWEDGLHRGITAITTIKQALAQPQEANNFCPRCGKRTPDPTAIHTCTPPRGLELT